ncbi:MAG TPA: hypothetical protein DCY14_09000 [Anaerolineae bacterium]|nr:hypothetical protein [Anaerolineae bacterium]HRJ58722.1 hypothetical protein [Anaerolineales bacterium]
MPRKTFDFTFVFKITAILSLTLVYVAQWATMIASPSLRTGTDFMAFYAAGRVAHLHGYSNAYNIDLQQEVQEGVVGFPLVQGQVLLYNHIPYLIPLLSSLVSADYVGSFLRWVALLFIIHTMAVVLLLGSIKNTSRSVLLFGNILFFPFFQSLLLGQDTSFLFLGVVLWVVGMTKKMDWMAGIGLALTSVRPHLCIVLAAPFLFYHRSVFWRFLAVVSVLVLISLLLLGKDGTFEFLTILQISAGGTWHGMHETDMVNLIGLATRLFPFVQSDVIRAVGWIGYIAGIFLTVVLWQKEAPCIKKISASLILALFFAPHLHYHDLTLLLVPLALLTWNDNRAAYLPLGISLLLLLLTPLYYVLPYVLYAGLAWLLVKRSSQLTGAMPPNPTG